jgi:hypothetical protein
MRQAEGDRDPESRIPEFTWLLSSRRESVSLCSKPFQLHFAYMIIPTPEFDPFYAHDGIPFQQKMLERIQRDYADLLAQDANSLLELQQLQSPFSQGQSRRKLPRQKSAA